MECDICNILKQEYRLIKETNYSFVCVNIAPMLEGHVMIIPKKHIENYSEFSNEEAKDFLNLFQETSLLLRDSYSKEGALSIINQGITSSQKHIHIHLMPVNKGEGLRNIISVFFKVPYNKEFEEKELEKMKNRILKKNENRM